MKKKKPLILNKMNDFTDVGTKAVEKAKAENHRLGLPNYYCDENGKIKADWPKKRLSITGLRF